MTYKCKICGGQATVDSNNGIAVCDYCGTKQVLPLFSDESEKLLYESGNNYLLHSEYDKAENVFNQLLTIKPGAAELYWDLVLCKYGVTYVKDPKTGKYIPTCNRTHYTPIFSDENYKKAIELSSGDKKALFEEDAKTIDDIQKGIIAVSKKEKPFDIFISYKETDANGNRTKDSVEAQKLYEKLTESGYKVFFSRITLESKIGSQYEPYIYAALSSSKVMLTVCSSEENIQAPWVKNEWSRFLTLRQGDSSKNLIPLYFDMDKSCLPEEFANLSAQDMEKDGFEQELIRGIKKLIPLPVLLAAKRKQNRKIFAMTSVIAVCVLAVVGTIAAPYIKDYAASNSAYKSAMVLYNDGKYSEAISAFESVSGFKDADEMRSKASNAYLTLQYNSAMELYNKGDFSEAAELFGNLGDFNDSADMKLKCESAQVNAELTEKYNAAMQLYYDGKYAQSAWAFKAISDFNDSAQMQKNAEFAWRQNLAMVATDFDYSSHYDFGPYYITANGSVELFPGAIGNNNENLEIDEHGKFISIAENWKLLGLHEDGYVSNSALVMNMESDWTDIIQITPVFDGTNVALKSDGTVIYNKNENYSFETAWLTGTESWENIVELQWCCSRADNGLLNWGVLAGIDADGKVHYVATQEELGRLLDSLSEVDNIVKLKMAYDTVVALDDQGNLYKYYTDDIYDGPISKSVTPNADILALEEKVFIDKDNNLRLYGNNRIILEDVVYCKEGYAITRSGSIYSYYSYASPTGLKTKVFEAWLERK